MAFEEDVYTKRFTEGCLAADSATPKAPAMLWGMTLLGSGSKVTIPATCAIPETPTLISLSVFH